MLKWGVEKSWARPVEKGKMPTSHIVITQSKWQAIHLKIAIQFNSKWIDIRGFKTMIVQLSSNSLNLHLLDLRSSMFLQRYAVAKYFEGSLAIIIINVESGTEHTCDIDVWVCLSINFHYHKMHPWSFNSDIALVILEVFYFSEWAFHVGQNKYLLVPYDIFLHIWCHCTVQINMTAQKGLQIWKNKSLNPWWHLENKKRLLSPLLPLNSLYSFKKIPIIIKLLQVA